MGCPDCSRDYAAGRRIYRAADGQFYDSNFPVSPVYDPEQFDALLKSKVESAKDRKEQKRVGEALWAKLYERLDEAYGSARSS